MPENNQISVTPLSPFIGAVIGGIDLREVLDADKIHLINTCLQEHLVVFFRRQTLDMDALYRLAAQFGNPVPYPYVDGVPGHPEIVEIRKLPEETLNFGGIWHSDTTYLKEPAMGAMLYAVEVPDEGGDTLFASMYRAFDCLSPGLQAFLAPLNALNEADKSAVSATRQGRRTAPPKGLVAEHPVVRAHPGTGRPALYVNPAHTTRFTGMTGQESQPILDHLFRVQCQPELTCRFRWEQGSLAFWDNRACQHYPLNDYHGQMRCLYRISLGGDVPCRYILPDQARATGNTPASNKRIHGR